ncbi:MAG: 4Fe-4S binding protein [bacterium]
MNDIVVNRELCNGCKLCFKACFIDIIKWDEAAKEPLTFCACTSGCGWQ